MRWGPLYTLCRTTLHEFAKHDGTQDYVDLVGAADRLSNDHAKALRNGLSRAREGDAEV